MGAALTTTPGSHRILPADSGRVAPHVTVLGNIRPGGCRSPRAPGNPRLRSRGAGPELAGPGRRCSASSPHHGGPGLPGAAGVRSRGRRPTEWEEPHRGAPGEPGPAPFPNTAGGWRGP